MAEATATKLTENDLVTVLEAIYEARERAYYVGLSLRIPPDILDNIRSQYDGHDDQLLYVIKEFLKGVDPRPTWSAIVTALKSPMVKMSKLAEDIEKTFCSSPKPDSTKELSHFCALESKLRGLQFLEIEESSEGVQKELVTRFLTESQQFGTPAEDVKEKLHVLYKQKKIITESVYRWSLSNMKEYSLQEEDLPLDFADLTLQTDSQHEVRLSKDTVYHASICCQALSCCTASNYQTFFGDSRKVPGHSFQAISISHPTPDSKQHERYLIARQGESTYYIAFESQPVLSQWPKKYNSFIEGVEFESKKFPILYIVELLNKPGCTIVLTGFSFGGLLACSLTAAVWNTPYIQPDVLKRRLICITFGQPHLTLPAVANVAKEQPAMKSVIHTIHLQDDIFPRLLSILNECCSELGSNEEKGGITLKSPSLAKLPFQDTKTREILDVISQVLDTKDKESLSLLKCLLKDVVPYSTVKKPNLLMSEMYTAHCVVCDPPPVGLIMREMLPEERKLFICPLQEHDVNNLPNDLYGQHEMSNYAHKLFHGFLKKQPQFCWPASLRDTPPELDDLKPTLSCVELHRHGNELVVVVEGSNLWFSYQTSLHRTQKIHIYGEESYGTFIKYILPGDHEDKVVVESGKVTVCLQTHFSLQPVKQLVTVHKKRFLVSTRQQQLATLTPSRLIELAYLSALLEQFPFHQSHKSQPVSHKVEVIKKFLKEVVHVVPLESIAHAIAHVPYGLAKCCVEALLASQIELPASVLMENGFHDAMLHLQHGAVSKGAAACKEDAKWVSKDSPMNIHCANTAQVQSSGVSAYGKEIAEGLQDEDIAKCSALVHRVIERVRAHRFSELICGASINVLYCTRSQSTHWQKQPFFISPLDVLRQGNSMLSRLAEELLYTTEISTSTKSNSEMLQTVNEIKKGDLAICTALLGGFMEQQEITIPLVKSTSDALRVKGPVSVGVWALSSLKYEDVDSLLSRQNDQLLVRIENYIKDILNREVKLQSEDERYTAKLQFIVQGIAKTVTCNSQYVGYSLERQLIDICRERNIDRNTSLEDLNDMWDALFEKNIFSLVAHSHRPLVSRWLKWSVMVHNLREKLAEFTVVGVVGLVNSGKSTLVSSLFEIEIPVGTREMKRTTVPFMYNLENKVDGLNVLDFPGVDDSDETIPDLAELLLFLAQVVVFVVDYRKAKTESTKKWLSKLKGHENVPVLVCLTFGDELYSEIAKKLCGRMTSTFPQRTDVEPLLKAERQAIIKNLKPPQSYTVQFFSFDQTWGSSLCSEEGRKKLKEVGILSAADVGKWLVGVFKRTFDQEDLAHRLKRFIC